MESIWTSILHRRFILEHHIVDIITLKKLMYNGCININYIIYNLLHAYLFVYKKIS